MFDLFTCMCTILRTLKCPSYSFAFSALNKLVTEFATGREETITWKTYDKEESLRSTLMSGYEQSARPERPTVLTSFYSLRTLKSLVSQDTPTWEADCPHLLLLIEDTEESGKSGYPDLRGRLSSPPSAHWGHWIVWQVRIPRPERPTVLTSFYSWGHWRVW